METTLCTPPRLKKSSQSKRPLTDHKRVLFPTNSPDQLDDTDRLANSLSSSPSVYSPPLPSPSWSCTPPNIRSPDKGKECELNINSKVNIVEIATNSLNKLDSPYNSSPRRSPRNLNNSPKYTNVDILTMLDSPLKEDKYSDGQNISDDFVTPKSVVKSPNSKKKSPILKPTSFYGNSAGLLARNEANSVAGIKKIYRVLVDSKVKTRLFPDSKPKASLKRSVHDHNNHKVKKRKELFTGVGHSLKLRKVEKRKHTSPESEKRLKSIENSVKQQASIRPKKQVNIQDKIHNSFDFTRMPSLKHKNKKDWSYPVLKFTKPERMNVEGESASKRKYFKTTLKSPGRAYFGTEMESPVMAKRRRLLNPQEDFLNTSQLTNASDILDLIEDGKIIEEEDKQVKEGVDDLILHLEDELQQQEYNNECTMQEDHVNSKTLCCDSNVLNISNLSIADNIEEKKLPEVDENIQTDKENAKKTPEKLFPVFEKRSTKFIDITNRSFENKMANSGGKKWHSIGDDQYQIDAGQKRFGATQCSACGVVYQIGDPDDEKEHEKFHKALKTLKHPGWQNEKVVGLNGLDRIILVTSENKMWWKKVLSVLEVIDEEIGYTTEDHSVLSHMKVYLYIKNKHIIGCLVATHISHAYKMLISEPGIDVCSEDSFPIKCGISRIWTHPLHRRQGIATYLLDAMRKSFYFGYFLTVDEIAFSVPTEEGKNFAKKYTKKSDYFVFTGW